MQAARAVIAASRANPEVFALGAKVGANAEFVAERIYHYYRDKNSRRRLTADPLTPIVTQSSQATQSPPPSPRMNRKRSYSGVTSRAKRAKFSSPPTLRTRPNIEVKTAIFGLPADCGNAATLYTRDLTAIGQDITAQTRIGSRISIIGLDINLNLGSAPAFVQLCLAKSYLGTPFDVTDFYSNWASPLNDETGVVYWRRIGGSGTSISTINKKIRFRYPITVVYKGSDTEAYHNRLFMCFYFGATSANMGGTMTVYYTDD